MSFVKKLWYKFKMDTIVGRAFSIISKTCGKPLTIMNADDTVGFIVHRKCSVARFGDGELHIAQEGCSIGFQESNKELQLRLRYILKSKSDSCLICLPSPINDCSYMTTEAQQVWLNDLKINRFYWRRLINKKNTFGDTQFTRPYIDYADKSFASARFEAIKAIWQNRKVLLIEGAQSRLCVNNDLFSDSLEVHRLLCPSRNAFSKYEEILERAKSFSKEHLILIALGPTATVLAYDLSKLGFQAIDIGHIDIEYEWCRLKVLDKVAVKGKYTNESMQNEVGSVVDEQYEKQIVGKIE